MGSLARGGFSEAASDIDIGVVLAGPLEPGDESRMSRVASRARAADQALPNRLSIFWGSLDSLNGLEHGGRFPPFDRLDLIDHGLLLHGRDVRSLLTRPCQRELVVSGAEFALETLATESRLSEFADVGRIIDQGIVYLTKTVLFPARFIYLERTGEVAGNDASAQYYCDEFDGPDGELVERAFAWRSEALPPARAIRQLLERGLVPLYLRFLSVYEPTLEAFGETGLVDGFARWRTRLAP